MVTFETNTFDQCRRQFAFRPFRRPAWVMALLLLPSHMDWFAVVIGYVLGTQSTAELYRIRTIQLMFAGSRGLRKVHDREHGAFLE